MDEITKAALNHDWEEHSNSRFYPARITSGKEARRVQQFLHLLKSNIDRHLRSRDGRESNYEDLYAAALQIVQDETHEIVNPLIADSVSEIRNASEALWRNQRAHIDDNAFASLAERATDLIQWTVYNLLAPIEKPIGLELLSVVAKEIDDIDIFTLNHDTLMEREFVRSSISFADGFGEKDGDVDQFNWSWNSGRSKIRMFKLHGSVDWYRFRFPKYVQYGKVHGDPDHCKNKKGQRLSLLDSAPLFLTGTTVKERSYGFSLIGELFAELRLRLRNHHTLICSGYGWGDKGINIRVRQWLYDAPQNKVVILHNGSTDELKQKRFWYFYWDDFEKADKVTVIPKWLCECNLQDLEPFFSN